MLRLLTKLSEFNCRIIQRRLLSDSVPECTIWRYDTRRGLPWLRTRNILRDISRHQSLAGELTERTSPHRTYWRERDGRRSSTDIIILIITTTAIIIILISRVCTARSACEGPRRQSGSPVRLLTGSQCVLQGDGRYSGVVLERKVLAPPQRNLGWLKKHRWGNVPAGGGSVSGVSFSVLHLYDKADFRKVGLSTCIRRGCGSGLCRWMKQHSPLSTFSLSSLNNGILSGQPSVHLLVLSPQACPHFMCLSRRIERRQLSKPDSSFTFPLNNVHFLYQRCYGSDFILFFLNSPV